MPSSSIVILPILHFALGGFFPGFFLAAAFFPVKVSPQNFFIFSVFVEGRYADVFEEDVPKATALYGGASLDL